MDDAPKERFRVVMAQSGFDRALEGSSFSRLASDTPNCAYR